jgi:hypothetical protein
LLPRRPDSKPACGLHIPSLPDWNADANTNSDTDAGDPHTDAFRNAYADPTDYADPDAYGYAQSNTEATPNSAPAPDSVVAISPSPVGEAVSFPYSGSGIGVKGSR